MICSSLCLVSEALFICAKGLIMGTVFSSGRRDFGEFSVYNPTKKASAAT